MSMPFARKLLLAGLLLVSAFHAAAAQASPTQLSIMMDDDQLLYRGDAVRDAALKRMKSLGVDTVRVTVLWSVVANDAKKGSRAKKFKGDNPKTYPKGNWDRYDRLDRACKTLGLICYFDVTGPGPSWAMGKAPKSEKANAKTWKPKAAEFRKFVKAVGKRYDGTYKDENDGKVTLPRVSFWAIYNEPNQGGWLTPQWSRKGSTVYNSAASMYRELWIAGRAALDATGHQNDVVLLGETAPLGSSGRKAKSPTYPKTFIRELFCVNSSNKPFTGNSAKVRGCSSLKKMGQFRASAWAHHPYTKDLAPTVRAKQKEAITMANLAELGGLLDQMATATKAIKPLEPTIMTEFGYETNPPDPLNGISPALQAEYINDGDYLAYKDQRVLGQTQFLLKDVAPVKGKKVGSKAYWFTYQSGLFDLAGKAKPSAGAYAMPLVVTGAGQDSTGRLAVSFWGQVRFLPDATQTSVLMQFRPQGAADYITIGDPVPVTNLKGFYEVQRPALGPGTWRSIWTTATGASVTSREVTVAG